MTHRLGLGRVGWGGHRVLLPLRARTPGHHGTNGKQGERPGHTGVPGHGTARGRTCRSRSAAHCLPSGL
ncbi:hypothetical protein SXIM_03180 [Streptomyces xiamenensis]|uniref:Uncharacterized protein n=1 Tax=Streptomyces xiamenensis TaxID=408015 RepID=A0A0F7FNZ7_9ACTN|nr:hypothetical protein SXIM_03180 [Streptomyces xiamenensis]